MKYVWTYYKRLNTLSFFFFKEEVVILDKSMEKKTLIFIFPLFSYIYIYIFFLTIRKLNLTFNEGVHVIGLQVS